jgi:hypothetical protein
VTDSDGKTVTDDNDETVTDDDDDWNKVMKMMT